jgi:hypothetical protein
LKKGCPRQRFAPEDYKSRTTFAQVSAIYTEFPQVS